MKTIIIKKIFRYIFGKKEEERVEIPLERGPVKEIQTIKFPQKSKSPRGNNKVKEIIWGVN